MYQTIVVATDGSATAKRAVAKAVELATLCGARIVIVSAYDRPSERDLFVARASLPEEYAWQVSSTSETDGVLREARDIAVRAGLRASVRAVGGEPIEAILGVAGDEDADLVVVGSKGMERRIMGSVPNGVAHRASCDILIVHTT